jgi:hypothetical protein
MDPWSESGARFGAGVQGTSRQVPPKPDRAQRPGAELGIHLADGSSGATGVTHHCRQHPRLEPYARDTKGQLIFPQVLPRR